MKSVASRLRLTTELSLSFMVKTEALKITIKWISFRKSIKEIIVRLLNLNYHSQGSTSLFTMFYKNLISSAKIPREQVGRNFFSA